MTLSINRELEFLDIFFAVNFLIQIIELVMKRNGNSYYTLIYLTKQNISKDIYLLEWYETIGMILLRDNLHSMLI